MKKFFTHELMIIVGLILFIFASAYGKSCGKYLSDKILPKPQFTKALNKKVSDWEKGELTAEEIKDLNKRAAIAGAKFSAKQINDKAPYMMNDSYRMDKADVQYPFCHYYMTIMAYREDFTAKQIREIKKIHKEDICKLVRSAESTRHMLERGFKFNHVVSDKAGKDMYSITTTKEYL